MNGHISIDIGAALLYYTDKLLSLIGKDATTRAANIRFLEMQQLAVERASAIQCVGMPDPVPIERLYQPSRLQPRRGDKTAPKSQITVAGLIRSGSSRTSTVKKSIPASTAYIADLREVCRLLDLNEVRLATESEFPGK